MSQNDVIQSSLVQHSLAEIFDTFTPFISTHLQTLRPDLTSPFADNLRPESRVSIRHVS